MIRLIIICISFISLFYTTAAVYSLQDKEKDFYTSIDPIILDLIKNVQHENFKAALNLADKLLQKRLLIRSDIFLNPRFTIR